MTHSRTREVFLRLIACGISIGRCSGVARDNAFAPWKMFHLVLGKRSQCAIVFSHTEAAGEWSTFLGAMEGPGHSDTHARDGVM